VITDKSGRAAAEEIERWAARIARTCNDEVETSVYDDSDSSTYVVRLAKGSRVLLFRLSAAQVRSPERAVECEKTLRSKIKDLETNR
jgi:hypothetical protein